MNRQVIICQTVGYRTYYNKVSFLYIKVSHSYIIWYHTYI